MFQSENLHLRCYAVLSDISEITQVAYSLSRGSSAALREYQATRSNVRNSCWSVYDQVKTESLESQAEAEELNQSQCVRTYIFLMVCPSASASDSVWFSLGHEGNEATDSIKQSRKKWTRSDSSCTDSFKLMTPLATPILDFHKVLRALTSPPAIPTPTPSPVNLCTDAPGEGSSVQSHKWNQNAVLTFS